MNHPLPSVAYPALKQLLLNQLQAALGLYVPDASELHQLEKHIPLHRAKDCRRVLYVSAIALQISQAKDISALEIATALAKLVICQAQSSPGAAASRDFTVRVVPPGCIHLEVTEPKLAAWLQGLTLGGMGSQRRAGVPEVTCGAGVPPLSQSDRPVEATGVRWGDGELPLVDTSRLFAVQHAHARCCSLVQMAEREKMITLREPDVALDPLPWLNSDRQLRLVHPAERALIAELVGLLDNLYCPGREEKMIDWEKAALNLSQAFQTFYSRCQIWGEVKIQTPHLAQARLGLVMATQSVLRLLLEDLFGVCAPREL